MQGTQASYLLGYRGCAILTGAGGEFIPGIDFPSFGNLRKRKT